MVHATRRRSTARPTARYRLPSALPLCAQAEEADKLQKAFAEQQWKEVKDSTSGKSYWYNRKTKATTWKNPTAEGGAAYNDKIAAEKAAADAEAVLKEKKEAESKLADASKKKTDAADAEEKRKAV